jgi:hypothetical protein
LVQQRPEGGLSHRRPAAHHRRMAPEDIKPFVKAKIATEVGKLAGIKVE